METDSKKSTSSLEEGSGMNILDLPFDALAQIFQHLCFNDLCSIGRVCKKWYQATRDEIFWRKIDACICKRYAPFSPLQIMNFVEILPCSVTHLKLNIPLVKNKWFISFAYFSEILRTKCPNLKTLILENMKFDVCGVNLDFCTQMPKYTRVLAFRNIHFQSVRGLEDKCCEIPKIEVLDLCSSKNLFIRPSSFLMISTLKKLRLAHCFTGKYPFEPVFPDLTYLPGTKNVDLFFATIVRILCKTLQVLDLECTMIHSITIHEICIRCVHLKELYVCFTSIKDEDLAFSNHDIIMPNLKVICLRNCRRVTSNGINKFMAVCTSVDHIYVGNECDNDEDKYLKCKSEKVHILHGFKHCYHYKKVDYMAE